MKKVVLLGDSIRLIGYGEKVAEMLKNDGCEVWQSEDNCRFAKYTLRMLFDEKANIEGADVIHWNNGLWDCTELFDDGMFTPVEEYVKEITRIAKILLATGAKVIFATTTPTNPTYEYTKTKNVKVYNEAIVPVLKDMGIEINDLFSAMEEHDVDGICEDLLHLNDLGKEICAKQVYEHIHNALEA